MTSRPRTHSPLSSISFYQSLAPVSSCVQTIINQPPKRRKTFITYLYPGYGLLLFKISQSFCQWPRWLRYNWQHQISNNTQHVTTQYRATQTHKKSCMGTNLLGVKFLVVWLTRSGHFYISINNLTLCSYLLISCYNLFPVRPEVGDLPGDDVDCSYYCSTAVVCCSEVLHLNKSTESSQPGPPGTIAWVCRLRSRLFIIWNTKSLGL